MKKGLLVVNAFLRTTKFDDIYQTLLEAAVDQNIILEVSTNAELCCQLDTPSFTQKQYDFVLFWDKDVQLAAQLELLGLPVFNSASSIFWCDDKAQTYLKLREAGLPMPRTILAPKTFSNIGYTHLDFASQAGRALGYPLVLKECFGSFGQQVYLIEDEAGLLQKTRDLAGTPILYQELIRESYGRDIRVNVVGGRVVAAILRRSTDGDFRSNLTRGGAMERYEPSPAQTALAVRAVEALALDFAGVDVLFGKNGPLLCEVNSNAHFKTTLQCTGVNMAKSILRHIAGKLDRL